MGLTEADEKGDQIEVCKHDHLDNQDVEGPPPPCKLQRERQRAE